MEPSLLLIRVEDGQTIAQTFDPSWSFIHGTMAVARLLKAAETIGDETPFHAAYLVHDLNVFPAQADFSPPRKGSDDDFVVTFYTVEDSIPNYVVRFIP